LNLLLQLLLLGLALDFPSFYRPLSSKKPFLPHNPRSANIRICAMKRHHGQVGTFQGDCPYLLWGAELVFQMIFLIPATRVWRKMHPTMHLTVFHAGTADSHHLHTLWGVVRLMPAVGPPWSAEGPPWIASSEPATITYHHRAPDVPLTHSGPVSLQGNGGIILGMTSCSPGDGDGNIVSLNFWREIVREIVDRVMLTHVRRERHCDGDKSQYH
jgi:hypothetical protein